MRGQDLFLSEKKRIREGNLTCPTSLVRPEPFLPHPKRIRSWEDQLSGGFIHHFEPTRAPHPFFSGGKGFLCSNPGNKLTLYHWKKGFTQNARSGTRVFKTRVLNAQTYRTNMLRYIYNIYIHIIYHNIHI